LFGNSPVLADNLTVAAGLPGEKKWLMKKELSILRKSRKIKMNILKEFLKNEVFPAFGCTESY
jgi:hypothetical protein